VDPACLRLKLIDFGCAKVLVRGQPNVSYICSRYYRAPELLFGATEYSCAVDMWSVGTILAELLLGHLPFQGQDSTQQHLVEILKLLGTPSERDLRAMGATCNASDLPKLRAYPWDRVFPSGTSQRAIDLAHRLLCFDPAQRLTASQALAHPFFEGVQYLLQDAEAGRPSSTHAKWQKALAALFDEYVASRSAAVADALPVLEKALLAGGGDSVEALLAAAKRELAPRLADIKRKESEAMAALAAAVLGSVRADPGAATEATARAAELTADVAKEHAAANGAAAEVASLREQLAKLEAELATARAGANVQSAGGGVTSGVARSSVVGGGMSSPMDRVAPSHRNSLRAGGEGAGSPAPSASLPNPLTLPP